jgi:hypothetical protein
MHEIATTARNATIVSYDCKLFIACNFDQIKLVIFGRKKCNGVDIRPVLLEYYYWSNMTIQAFASRARVPK